ncbi:DUF7513 family protein [Haloplanus salilacus]|uniref:DUF7513 family protein n=1 Tax=Haloplanus salilacus TaxID=2949994 RepID=UPI0030D08EFC
MSLLGKYLRGWSFRTSRPSFDVDDEIEVFLTGVENGTVVARVGDTIIRVPDADPEYVDTQCRIRITEFDDGDATGEATFVAKVGESAF